MQKDIKQRIEQIKNGIIPKGYKKTFDGFFPNDWETVRLGDIFKERVEKGREDLPLLSITGNEGVIPRSQISRKDSSSKDKSKYLRICKGDIGYNTMRMWQGVSALSNYEGIVSPAYTVLKPTDGVCTKYFAYLFKTEKNIFKFYRYSQGLVDDTRNLKYNSFKIIQVTIPPVKEQQKIVAILSSQDKVIECYEKKIEQLKQMKKYYLQNMFPKRGESVPKIRVKGFTDPWKQRKLGECVEFLDTMRKPLKESEREKGIYPYYGASGIVDYISNYIFDEELVLLSEDGANITDRNYPVCFLASGKYWVNNHAHVLRVYTENENNFICNSLERMDFTKYNSGMAMPKLNKDVCNNIPLFCPIYEEQKQIGDYFRTFDNLITLHQRKLEEEKKKKKAMQQLLLTGIVRVNHE